MASLKLKLIAESPYDLEDFEVIEEQSNLKGQSTLYVAGPMIGCGSKNKNGRLYEKNSTRSEVNRYIEEMVNTGRAMGELNHPTCYTESASILTEDGWKGIKDVKLDERVYTLNSETREMELYPITRKIDEYYSGRMFRVKGRNIDTLVTPKHKFPIYSRYGKYELVSIEDIYNNRQKYNKHFIPRTAQFFSDENDENFILDGYSGVEKTGNYNIDPETSSTIPMSTMVKFLGLWLSEGHVSGKTSVGISQKKESVKVYIKEVLSEFPKEMIWKEYKSEDEVSQFILLDYRLNRFLRENFGDSCYNKKISKRFKNLSPQFLEELLYAYNLGDGRFNTVKEGNSEYYIRNVFTTSENLIMDLNEILTKTGSCGNITVFEATSDVMIKGRVIKKENMVPLYQLNLAKTKNIWLDSRFLSIEPEEYSGMVYCVTVQNSNFYAMDNGKPHWSGNCADVNLERACHLVTELKEIDDGFYGKAKVLSTPCGQILRALINDGVKVGMSTRALGSLKEHADYNLVENMHLVAIDTVADPSHSKAFVNGILESKTFVVEEDGRFEEMYDNFSKVISKIPKKEADSYLREQIVRFINSLG